MRRVKKNTKAKVPAAISAKIAAFRKARSWTAVELATRLGLSGPNIVYAWESGAYAPSAENYIGLANLAAPDWRYIEWFLRHAGVQERTLNQAADMLLHSGQQKQMSDLISLMGEEFAHALEVPVSPLTKGQPILRFPAWFLTNPASTKYVGRPNGDLVLIDTLQVDVRTFPEGTLLAVDSGEKDAPLLGFVRKQAANSDTEHYLLRIVESDMPSGDVFLGSSVGEKPAAMTREGVILGRVAAWITPTGRQESEKK
jgi:transcriptional regulator with XRE-family HTH domain